jgi:hypothetical protein
LSEFKLRRPGSGVVLPVPLTPKSARDEIIGIAAFGGETVLKARCLRCLKEAVPMTRVSGSSQAG